MEGLTGMRSGIASNAAEKGAVSAVGGGPARALMPLKAALDRYKTLQGAGKFSEAGSELERIEKLIQRMISGD